MKDRNQREEVSEDVQDAHVEFGGFNSAYATLYNLKPGGYSSISALETSPTHDPSIPPSYTTCSDKIAQIVFE